MTTPLARLVATRLNEGPAVKRLFYLANLFRYEETQAGRQCEFNQAGVEMMGAAGPSADAEMLALAVASLQAAGLNDFVISVGQIDFINGLIEAAEVTELQAQELKRCLIEHDVVRLEALADGSRMSPEQKDLFKELPFLHGGLELLDKVEACGLNNKSSKAVQDLREMLWPRSMVRLVICVLIWGFCATLIIILECYLKATLRIWVSRSLAAAVMIQ